MRPGCGAILALPVVMLADRARSFGETQALEDVRVLVVDSDTQSARMLSAVLEREGSEARVARSAEDALAELRTFAAHAVVLDLVLPRMSGLLLARRLKQTTATRGAVLIAVSPIDSPFTAQLARTAGCAAYLSKPIDVEAFPKILAEHLKGRP